MTVVQGTANGTIRYNIPSSYQGTTFENVELTFRDGVIIQAKSNHTELLNEILDTDKGARRIGEFAIGFNPLIRKPMLDTLFDEKMRMSLHFTPGNGSNNPSAIHWDLVQSHDPAYGGGEIWFDDVLVRKDGLFVLDELKCMNPDELIRQHRTIGQAAPAWIFGSIHSLENEGILYVFLVFQTEEVGQKDGCDSQTQLRGVAIKEILVPDEGHA